MRVVSVTSADDLHWYDEKLCELLSDASSLMMSLEASKDCFRLYQKAIVKFDYWRHNSEIADSLQEIEEAQISLSELIDELLDYRNMRSHFSVEDVEDGEALLYVGAIFDSIEAVQKGLQLRNEKSVLLTRLVNELKESAL